MAWKKGLQESYGRWSYILQVNWPSNLTLGWGIWTQFWPWGGGGVERTNLQKFQYHVKASNWSMHNLRKRSLAIIFRLGLVPERDWPGVNTAPNLFTFVKIWRTTWPSSLLRLDKCIFETYLAVVERNFCLVPFDHWLCKRNIPL